jgi:hypothetical protein
MCDFISWIETERKGKKILCYLTDQEVFSSIGREVFPKEETKDNDVLGHGAIRLFFNLKKEGTEHEETNFWDPENLPGELTEKIKDFDTHWGRMFTSGIFQNDDLRYIIEYAPNKWREKAWQQLLKQNPSNGDLCYIIVCAPNEWREKARKILNG